MRLCIADDGAGDGLQFGEVGVAIAQFDLHGKAGGVADALYRRRGDHQNLRLRDRCHLLVKPDEQRSQILARTTRRAKILLLGNILPIEENPVRLAEQIAMSDLISGGRVLSGFVRGVGVEQWWSNVNPMHKRERFDECHDLILKCWTEPGPFRWEGRHYHFRHVNPWCLPLQKPHPPIWIPGTASPETAIWAGRRGYTFVPFLVPFDIARELFDYYRQGAAEVGREVTPDKLGFLICAVTADTKTKALEAGRHFVWRMGATLRGPVEFFSPVGMRSRTGSQFALNHARSGR